MKKLFTAIALSIVCAGGFVSCNKIPNKSVFIPLTDQEKSNIQEVDTNFHSIINSSPWNEVIKYETDSAKQAFQDITYRDMYKYFQLLHDTAYWTPLYAKWETEYASLFPNIDIKFDSVLAHYDSIINSCDLNNYVQVELQGFDIDYYRYIGGVDEAYFIFKFIPLQGKIQQLGFTYKYKYKIDDNGWKTNYCTLQNPFSKPYSAYYKIDYSEKEKFYSMTKAKFLERYDLEIEVTKILKDGEIIEKEVLPFSIQQYREALAKDKSYMQEYYKESIIKEFINKDYITLDQYRINHRDEIVNSDAKNKHINDFIDWLWDECYK